MNNPSPHEQELFLNARRDAFRWQVVGFIGLVIGAASIAGWAFFLPLKEIRAVPFSIDPATKLPVLLYDRVETLQASEAMAMREVRDYIVNRETYDVQDNQARVYNVLDRSVGGARSDFSALWTEGGDQHPDRQYGQKARVETLVDAISPISPGVMQADVVKTLFQPNKPLRSARFKVTLSYAFEPKTLTSMDELIANPFGFIVSAYRIDAIGEAR